MKFLALAITLLFVHVAMFGQSTKKAKKEISTLIKNFSSAVNTRNIELVEPLLNENFRVIIHQFPTDDQTTILTKETYTMLLKGGQIGGEKRTVTIESIDITNHIASAKIKFKSNNLVLTTYQTFILNKNNVWQIISDIPHIKKKNEPSSN